MSASNPDAPASTTTAAPISTWGLIKWPALVTLIVTVVRLVGEIQGWSPKYFNSEGGGAGALVGIVWLAPLFGIWFGRRLEGAGQGPGSRGRAIVWPLIALVVLFAAFFTIIKVFGPGDDPKKPIGPEFIFAIQGSSLVCAAIAWRGWPKIARVNLSYGLLARIPVAVVMLIAINAKWGTHYEKGPPGLPEYPLMEKWLLIGVLPQLIGWVSFTIIAGGLFGALSLLLGRKESAAPVAAATPAPPAPAPQVPAPQRSAPQDPAPQAPAPQGD